MLKRASATAIGITGATQVSGSTLAKGKPDHAGKPEDKGPCHKDFECGEGGTYVKFEFVSQQEEEDSSCYFEEETDTGLLEITNWDSKDDEECEPISVTWELTSGDQGYTVSKGLVYGGRDCDEIDDTGSGSYESELENPGGDLAAISNLQFCLQSGG